MSNMIYSMGSLFDGSGGFPLAASLCGIEPKWAAEIEPYPIAVTRSRFPGMRHLGDISKVNGADIEPVDIITFGSPCQDLSVAGKRAGLKHEVNGDDETTRSGLFMEAVRIIKEMREATNGEYPRFALWENVPGAFSSNKGEDFRTVLAELVNIVEPTAVMPPVPKAGWNYADDYRGDGWSLAYRVFDAQYWGVPQRRRRIHLVVDFRGERAREVLFEREGVRGYFEKGRTPWQGTTSVAEEGSGAADREGTTLSNGAGGQLAACLYASYGTKWNGNGGAYSGENFVVEQRDGGHGGRQLDAVGINGSVAGTLDANYFKGCGLRQGVEREVVFVPYTPKIRSGCEGGGKGALIQTDMSATLATNNDQYLFQPTPAVCFDARGNGDGETVNTLTGDHNRRIADYSSVVVEPIPIHDQATRFSGKRGEKADGKGNGLGVGNPGDPMNTLTSADRHAVVYALSSKQQSLVTSADCANTLGANDYKEPQAVAFQTYQKVTGPLMANSHPGSYTGQDAFSDMLVAGVEKQAVGYRQGSFANYVENEVGTLKAAGGDLGGGSENLVVIRPEYIVRRLTPTECTRLQGFADCWGHIDQRDSFTPEEYRFWLEVRNTHAAINGKAVKDYTEAQMLAWYNKLHTDAAEYKMWGNGIALPPALYCMQGMAECLCLHNHACTATGGEWEK